MGIYIKGMDIPKSLGVCVTIYPDGRVVNFHGSGPVEVVGTAIPVPPHGRLIDADELKHVIGQFDLSWEYGQGVFDCWDALLKAPTIIEAEGSE